MEGGRGVGEAVIGSSMTQAGLRARDMTLHLRRHGSSVDALARRERDQDAANVFVTGLCRKLERRLAVARRLWLCSDPEQRGDYFRMTVERGDRQWCLPGVVAARGLRPGRMEH